MSAASSPASRSGSLQAQWNDTLSHATYHLRSGPNTSPWVKAIGLVEFDLQLGIVLRYLNPPLPLAVKQETEIAFLCFPDANLVEDGDSILDFIYAYNPEECDQQRTTIKRMHESEGDGKEDSGSPTRSGERQGYGSNYKELFCTALFRQKRDPTVTRGARQNAIVVMGDYPLPGIYRQLLAQLSIYLDTPGADPENFLVAAQSAIDSWPAPLPNKCYTELPFIGHTISFTTPNYQTSHCWSAAQLKDRSSFRNFTALDRAIEMLERLAGSSNEEGEDKQRTLKEALSSSLQSMTQGSEELSAICKRSGWSVPADTDRLQSGQVSELASKLLTAKFTNSNLPLPSAETITLETGLLEPDQLKLLRETLTEDDASRIPEGALKNEQLMRLQALYQSLWSYVVVAKEEGENFKEARPDQRRAVFSELQLNSSLYPHITKLWKFWELMIIGAPLGIIGPSGPSVSAMALSICSLIAPLDYVGLLRPYLTINNREIDHCVRSVAEPGAIVAATNPFFVKHLGKWPHFLCVGTVDGDVQTHKTLAADSEKRAKQQFKLKNRMFCSRHYLVKTDKTNHDKWLKAPPSEGGRFVDGPDAVSTSSASIRETFSLLTHEFLLPIRKFVCHNLEAKCLYFSEDEEPFSHQAIMNHLKSTPPSSFNRFKTVGEALEVYSKFLSSPTFYGWLTQLLQRQYREFIVEQMGSISDVFAILPKESSRLAALSKIQWDFETALLQPLLDPPYLAKLSKLCQEASLFRKFLLEEPHEGS